MFAVGQARYGKEQVFSRRLEFLKSRLPPCHYFVTFLPLQSKRNSTFKAGFPEQKIFINSCRCSLKIHFFHGPVN